jgi:hypothetical protein
MKEGNHIVKSKVFEVSFNLEKQGIDFQKSLSQLIKEELNSITERCLAHFDSPITQYIHRIELNLRDIPYDGFEKLLPQLYEEKLMKALTERLSDQQKKPTEPRSKSGSDHVIVMIRYFLMKGYMPWNFNNANWNSFNELFDHAFLKHEQELLQELQLLLKSSAARVRLVNHINDRSTKELVRKVEPAQAELIISYHKDWMNIQKRQPVFKSNEKELSKRFWLFILNYLYEERGSYFNTKAFLLSTLRQVASHFNVSFESAISLLQHSYEAEAKSGAKGTFHDMIGDILNEYHLQEGFPSNAQDERQELASNLLSLDQLCAFALHNEWKSTLPQSSHLVEKSIAHWVQKRPQKIIELLKNLAINVQAVYDFIYPLSEPAIHGLVRVLAPGEERHIIQYQDQVVRIQKEKNILAHSGTNFSKLIWSMVILILADNHGSYFNHKTFTRALVQQMARQYNIAYKTLLQSLWDNLKATSAERHGFVRLFNLIKDIYNEDFGGNTKTKVRPLALKEMEIIWLYRSISEQRLVKEIEAQGYRHLDEFLKLYIETEPQSFYQLILKHHKEGLFNQKLLKLMSSRLLWILLREVQPRESVHWQRLLEAAEEVPSLRILNPAAHQKVIREFVFAFVLNPAGYQSATIERALLQITARHGVDFNAFIRSFLWLIKTTQHEQLLVPVVQIAEKYRIATDSRPEKLDAKDQEHDPQKLDAAMTDQLMTILLSGIHGIFDRKSAIKLGFKSVDEVLTYLRKNRPDRLKKSMGSLQMESHPFVGIGREIPLSSFYALLITLKPHEGRMLVELLRILELNLQGSSQSLNRFLSAARSLALVNLSRRVFNLNHFLEEFAALILSTAPGVYIQVIPILTKNLSSLSLPSSGNVTSAIHQLEKHLNHSIDLRSPMDKESLKKLIEQEYFKKGLSKESTTIPYFEETTNAIFDEVYINNAGLAIVNSYIPVLFERFGLVKSGAFLSSDHQQKAALLLQYIMLDRPPLDEHHLPFNKLLCGLPLEEPIQTALVPTEQEMKMVHGLIEAVIQHWSSIGKSSVEGFRGSWLWRKGKMEHKEENWLLRVEQNSYDILLDRIPFSLSPIKYSWMPKPLIVEWR